MELYDYELNLQSDIVCWKCSRHAECSMDFIPKPRHLKLGMSGLLWSIQALPLQNPTKYSFNIMEVKRSRSVLPLSEAAAPDLPAKFKLLLVGFEESMKSVRRAQEALDKLYAFSRLYLQAEKDERWWIVLDAEIMAMACEAAREAIYQAAQVVADFFAEQFEPPVFIGGLQSKSCERSGWWIDQWTVADELWASSFFAGESWNAMMRLIQAKAVERGNVVQWCTVKVDPEKPNPYFEFQVAVHEFLEGDEVLMRIGVANDRALRVRVFLTEAVEVLCSQEGIEPETSLGLAYLLPAVVKDYIMAALGRNEAKLSNNNVVEGLLQHLIRYLAFLGKLCVICGSDRLLEVPASSTCSNLCKARKQGYEAAIAGCLPGLKISEEGRATRREQYVRKLYNNNSTARKPSELGILLDATVVHDSEIGKDQNLVGYEEAVRKVARMNSRSIAKALQTTTTTTTSALRNPVTPTRRAHRRSTSSSSSASDSVPTTPTSPKYRNEMLPKNNIMNTMALNNEGAVTSPTHNVDTYTPNSHINTQTTTTSKVNRVPSKTVGGDRPVKIVGNGNDGELSPRYSSDDATPARRSFMGRLTGSNRRVY